MGKSDDAGILESIKSQLDSLRRTPDGAFLYRIIVRALDKYGIKNGKMELPFMAFLYSVLGKYIKDPKSNASTRMKARFIQQRLRIHLPAEWVAKNDDKPNPANRKSRPKPSGSHKIHDDMWRSDKTDLGYSNVDTRETETAGELSYNLNDTIVTNKEFSALLKSNLKALQLAETPDDLMELKHLLVKGMEDLIQGHHSITNKITATTSYVKQAREDRSRMQRELENIRKHSAADGLTGLPRREVLLHQLTAEISRAKRYGFSLAISLLGIDGLSTIKERYGHNAGDEVLQCYATQVLANFRNYDLVARYTEDEFAILLPNTQKDGAHKALEKAQKNAANIVITHDSRSFPLPGFTSVLAIYSQGENPEALLKRANDALSVAKDRSRGEVVLSLPSN